MPTKDLPIVQESVRLLQLNWYLLPLFGIDERGNCTCGQSPCPHRAGKHPVLKNGWKGASNRVADIWNWFHQRPNANLGISLELSNLLVIAPDAPEWHDTFRAWGLPNTAIAQSGGGAGHLHYYYLRPPDCPLSRINRSAEYDIQSSGYMVVAPSKHVSGNPYVWLTHPLGFQELPFAPAWAVDLLHEVKERRQVALQLKLRDLPPLEGDQPPVDLDEDGMLLWTGAEYIGTENHIDRSATLYALGAALADQGAAHLGIIASLANRDDALGYRKYTRRPFEYQRIAIKLLGPMP